MHDATISKCQNLWKSLKSHKKQKLRWTTLAKVLIGLSWQDGIPYDRYLIPTLVSIKMKWEDLVGSWSMIHWKAVIKAVLTCLQTRFVKIFCCKWGWWICSYCCIYRSMSQMSLDTLLTNWITEKNKILM